MGEEIRTYYCDSEFGIEVCHFQQIKHDFPIHFHEYYIVGAIENDCRETCLLYTSTCLPQIEDANVLSATANAPDMLMSLNAGKCDIVVTDQPTGKGALIAYPDFVMLDFGGAEGDFQVTDEEINIGISMKKGNTELKSAIDGVLSKMTKDDYSKIMDEAIAVQPLANQ